jgi:outer membrane protein TolC
VIFNRKYALKKLAFRALWSVAGLAVSALASAEPAANVPTLGPAPPPTKAPRPKATLTLKRCLELADLNYPKIHEARARLANKRAQRFQAYSQPFSEFTASGGLAYAPTLRGSSIYSPDSDVALKSDMGFAWNVGIEGVIPLWTFGKITSLWDAAEAQVAVGENEVKKEKNDVRLTVRRAYYGVQLARDGLVIVRDAMTRIDKYLGRLEARVNEGEGDDIELLKLKMYRAELDARESEAVKQESIALSGLKFLTGYEGALDVPDHPIRLIPHHLGPLAHYLSAARLYRPEVNMARAGILAREAQVRLEKARYFPDIGIGVGARWARAPEVTDQRNPFVSDRANYLSFGVALAFKWKLDLVPQYGRVAQATAQLEEIRATERYALGGVGAEVEQAFRETEDAARRLDAYTRATQYAKQWLVQVQQGIDVGTFEDEDIVQPAKEYALKRFSQMSATYDYNMALAKLAQVTGWDAIANHNE